MQPWAQRSTLSHDGTLTNATYTNLDSPTMDSSQQPGEKSALQNVFGSSVSLAELNGDTSRVGSRFPTRAPTPDADVPRMTPPTSSRGLRRKRALSVSQRAPAWRHYSIGGFVLCLLALFVCGVVHGMVVLNFISMGRFGSELANSALHDQRTAIVAAGLLAVCLGLLFPVVDYLFPERMHTGKSGADWASIIRASGAVLGLTYAMTKLASGAWLLWGLANPILWYIIDSTAVGFGLSAALAVAGGALTSLVGAGHSGTPLQRLEDLFGIAAVYFSASILWGNLGRRLLSARTSSKTQPI